MNTLSLDVRTATELHRLPTMERNKSCLEAIGMLDITAVLKVVKLAAERL